MRLIFLSFRASYRKMMFNNFLRNGIYGKYIVINLGGPIKHYIAKLLIFLGIGRGISCDGDPSISDISKGINFWTRNFLYIPDKDKNIRTPHTGIVILEEGVEVAANSTIDRGSLADTVIGKNTFLDNQVHVAHNVQIGKNCMVAGQVGFAGSTTIGDNVVVGGQAGISGHLKIGNNVKIGGGRGVINDIPDNHQVMGYPDVPLKDFVKKRKK